MSVTRSIHLFQRRNRREAPLQEEVGESKLKPEKRRKVQEKRYAQNTAMEHFRKRFEQVI